MHGPPRPITTRACTPGTDALPLHYNGKLYPIPSLSAVSVFDSMLSYYDAKNPTGSVKTPVTGAKIEVLGTGTASDGGVYMGVRVMAPSLE
ncbi:MAG: hypothetical protein D9V44_10450 [Actinobacteria bacterium]|nr:MAG: hypothetical protein D9V44_10450 [Actinomycetota bacterium]